MNIKARLWKIPMQLLCKRALLLAMSLIPFHVQACYLFIRGGDAIQCTVTGPRRNSDDFS